MKQAMINYMKKPKSDEVYTPSYAVDPILKYLKPNSKILCPFDTETSNYVKELTKAGHAVIFSHINGATNYKDFFSYTKNELKNIDYIVSNPPFSSKDKVLEKLYELNIPFAMLLPLTSLEGVKRHFLFAEHGVELLIFDKRINFLAEKKSNWFNTSYFCWNVLPRKIIFEKLLKT